MPEPQSPALSNSTVPSRQRPNSPRAGFRAARPMGTGSSSKGPTLTGWPRDITWDEFEERGSRPSGEDENAQISVQMNGIEVSVVRENGRYRLGEGNLEMILVSGETWVVQDSQSTELLQHEQGHFDIAGLCYRDMVKKLQKLRTRSSARLASETKRIMAAGDKKGDDLSKLYDSKDETDHGRNKERQKAWEQAIELSKTSGKPLKRPA